MSEVQQQSLHRSEHIFTRRTFWRDILTCLCLVLAVLLIYGQTFSFKFVNFDDDVHVSENDHVTTGLTWANLMWSFGIHGPSQWHPLAWLSHQLDCSLFGLNAGGHHATSVLIHALSAVILFLVLQRVFRRWNIAVFVAAGFAVHPLNVESVAWISERRNVLCALFFGLTLGLYAGYVSKPSWWRYGLVMVAHVAALMSKPLAVTIPCVLFLLDLWPFRRFELTPAPGIQKTSIQKGILEKLPLLALSLVASVLTILCQRAVGTIASFDAIPFSMRAINAFAAYGWYLQKLFWPVHLGVFYPHPALIGPAPWSELAVPALISSVVLVGITIAAACLLRSAPWLALGWSWYLGVMFPMIGIMQVGEQQQADRYAYLPTIGLFLILACAGSRCESLFSRGKRIVPVLATLLLLGWGYVAFRQASVWRSSVTLFSHTIKVTERNHWAHNNLGFAYLKLGRTQEAAEEFQRAIQAVPNYSLAHSNLGVALEELGQRDNARDKFETALQLDPGNVIAHQRFAVILLQSGETKSAIEHFRAAVTLSPDDPSACFNLGLALSKTGQNGAAIPWLERSLKLNPDHLETVLALALALRDLGRASAARTILNQFLDKNPDDLDARQLLNDLENKSPDP